MEATGVLKVKSDTKKVSEKFQSRDFVLTTELSTPYPQHVSFQLAQDKCGLLDGFNIGDEVKVLFNLKGREWTSPQGEVKYFNTLDAWRIERPGAVSTPKAKTNVQESNNPPEFHASSAEDDVPF